MLPMIQARILERVLDRCAITEELRCALLASEHLDSSALAKTDVLVPLGAYLRIFDQLASQLRRPALGLQLAATIGPELVGAIGYLFLNSPTLDAALSAYSDSIFSIQGVTELSFVRAPQPMVSYVITDDAMQPRRQDVEFSLGHVNALIRSFLGPGYAPIEVHFAHPLVGKLSTYDEAFGCAVHFEQPRNALLLKPDDLRRPSPSVDPALAAILRHYLQLVDRRDHAPESWADRVHDLIAAGEVEGPNLPRQIAGRLGLGLHVLQRRLATEGTCLRQVALQRRMAVARRHLLESDMSILEIAGLLGYSEAASFSRAFKAQCGESPRQFKLHNRRIAQA